MTTVCTFCHGGAGKGVERLFTASAAAICETCLKKAQESLYGKPLFRVSYAHKGDVEEALRVQFDGYEEFTAGMMTAFVDAIAARVARDEVLELMGEAVQAQMIELFYRELASRAAELEAAGLPMENAIRKIRDEFASAKSPDAT